MPLVYGRMSYEAGNYPPLGVLRLWRFVALSKEERDGQRRRPTQSAQGLSEAPEGDRLATEPAAIWGMPDTGGNHERDHQGSGDFSGAIRG
jgi:hypothetical protein